MRRSPRATPSYESDLLRLEITITLIRVTGYAEGYFLNNSHITRGIREIKRLFQIDARWFPNRAPQNMTHIMTQLRAYFAGTCAFTC